MKSDYILCSTKDDLIHVDRASLRMNGIMVTDNLSQGLEPLLEGEASCLLLTDKIIEEQSSIEEVTKNVNILYEIYGKDVRIIYIKLGGDYDSLVQLMDENSNWDIYYNEELRKLNSEDIITMFNERKIPSKDNKQDVSKSIKSIIIERANSLSKELVETLKENIDLENNTSFKSVVYRNLSLVKDLTLAYEYLKEDLDDNQDIIKKLKVTIEKQNQDLKELRFSRKQLEENLEELDNNRKKIFNSLTELQSTHNTLVDNLSEVLNINDIHSSLSKVINVDKYKHKAPLVIYFKEYTPIKYMTTFLKNLNTLLTKTIGLSRLLIIENDLHTNKLPLYLEKNFVYVTDGTNMSNIVLGNLVTCGNNHKLLNYLIQNSLQLDILIIFDRTGSSRDFVVGRNVIKFNIVKNLEDLEAFSIGSTNVVSNKPEANYFLGEIENYKEIEKNMDLELSVISSLEITKKLITYITTWDKVKIIE